MNNPYPMICDVCGEEVPDGSDYRTIIFSTFLAVPALEKLVCSACLRRCNYWHGVMLTCQRQEVWTKYPQAQQIRDSDPEYQRWYAFPPLTRPITRRWIPADQRLMTLKAECRQCQQPFDGTYWHPPSLQMPPALCPECSSVLTRLGP